MCALIFFTPFVWNTSYPKKNRLRNDQKCTFVFTYSSTYCCYSYQILITFVLWHIFQKYPNSKFCKNPSCGSQLVPCEQTNRRTDGQTWRKRYCFSNVSNWLKMTHFPVSVSYDESYSVILPIPWLLTQSKAYNVWRQREDNQQIINESG